MKEGEYTWYDPLGEFAVQEEEYYGIIKTCDILIFLLVLRGI